MNGPAIINMRPHYWPVCQTKGMEGTFLIYFTLVFSGWLLKSVFHHKQSLIRLHMSALSVFSFQNLFFSLSVNHDVAK